MWSGAVKRYPGTAAAALAVIGLFRLFSTYGEFSQTYDEPWHIAGGVEWLDRGSYTLGYEHPPLGRVAAAIGPFLLGARTVSRYPDHTDNGNEILYASGRYWTMLKAARLGTAVFFLLACGFVFLWARRWFGPYQAVLATLLFTSLPPILGHSAVATVDAAQAATLTAALYCLLRWLESGSVRWAWIAGAGCGLALLAKFSNVPFYVACLAVALAVRRPGRALLRQLAIFPLAAALTIWSGYRWSVRPLAGAAPLVDTMAKHTGENSSLTRAAIRVSQVPLPLVEFIAGVWEVFRFTKKGHPSYLLGEYRRTGWWHFFPVVLAVKTPLAFVLLACGGFWLAVRRFGACSWPLRLTMLFPVAILLVCMLSRFQVGVRHAISIYPMLSILVAHAAVRWMSAPRPAMRAAAAVLVLLVVAESAAAHPDYLAAFNPLAGRNPERILCESDLDWGQDLRRLSVRLKERGATRVAIAYFGTARLNESGLPEVSLLSPTTPTTGPIAISAYHFILSHAKDGSFAWLHRYRPVERIGKSIFFFDIPAIAVPPPRKAAAAMIRRPTI